MSTFDAALTQLNESVMETFGDLREITKGDFADTVMADFWIVPAGVSAAGESYDHPQPMLAVMRDDIREDMGPDLSGGSVVVGDKTYRIIRPVSDQAPASQWMEYELGLPK